MGRVWILAGALMVVAVILFIFSGFIGTVGMLTMGLCIGGGAAAAYLVGTPTLGRAMYLFGGVLVGALGFLLGTGAFPDTNTGLFLGAVVPWAIMAFCAMWSKRQDMFLAMVIGGGALAGVYASVFNLDPQSINVSLPIAMGQTILPLGLGYLAAVIVRTFIGDDPIKEKKADADSTEPSDDESTTWEPADADTQQLKADADTQQLSVEETR